MVFGRRIAQETKLKSDNSRESPRPSLGPSGSPPRKLGDRQVDLRASARGF